MRAMNKYSEERVWGMGKQMLMISPKRKKQNMFKVSTFAYKFM